MLVGYYGSHNNFDSQIDLPSLVSAPSLDLITEKIPNITQPGDEIRVDFQLYNCLELEQCCLDLVLSYL